ncbi:MAG: hypothetical protein U1D31_02100 [Patescibacteria group bacterium]|nr:hypothetical protein [bacterium]MDZ4240894.1 hypothetical protein [Patescibacteria group bacterium]
MKQQAECAVKGVVFKVGDCRRHYVLDLSARIGRFSFRKKTSFFRKPVPVFSKAAARAYAMYACEMEVIGKRELLFLINRINHSCLGELSSMDLVIYAKLIEPTLISA